MKLSKEEFKAEMKARAEYRRKQEQAEVRHVCCGRTCCGNPDVVTPEHDCPGDGCDSCFVLLCNNCGATCGCDL